MKSTELLREPNFSFYCRVVRGSLGTAKKKPQKFRGSTKKNPIILPSFFTLRNSLTWTQITVIYPYLSGLTVFLLCFTLFYWVLSDFTGFYWVLSCRMIDDCFYRFFFSFFGCILKERHRNSVTYLVFSSRKKNR